VKQNPTGLSQGLTVPVTKPKQFPFPFNMPRFERGYVQKRNECGLRLKFEKQHGFRRCVPPIIDPQKAKRNDKNSPHETM
jgi:hypothetical protein